jgi:hypothetical protein
MDQLDKLSRDQLIEELKLLRKQKSESEALEDKLENANTKYYTSNQQLKANEQQLRLMLDKLQKHEQQFKSMFDGIDDVMYVADPETYELVHANDTAKEIWGAEMVGKKCYEVLHNRTSPCPFCTNDIIFNKNPGQAYVWEKEFSKTSNWFKCTDKVIEWPDGRKLRFEKATDITNLKISNAKLEVSEQQLKASNQQLESLNQQLAASNQQLIASEKEIKLKSDQLRERLKELNCLYKVSTSLTKYSNIEQVLQNATDIISISWQHPEITTCRISYKEKAFTSKDFTSSKWTQTANILVKGKIAGKIEVFYLKKMSESHEGPFLKEERELINSIAVTLGQIIEKNLAENELVLSNQQLAANEQQLKAANQQLIASEQQLKAYNLQLKANEQQLKAANQQLIASEQQLKAYNQQLIASEKRFRSYIENAPIGIFICDKTGKFLDVNKTAEIMTGFNDIELRKKDVISIFEKANQELAIQAFSKLAETGEAQIEIPYSTKSGEQKYWIVNGVKISNNNFLGFVTDISERKETERHLRSLLENPAGYVIYRTRANREQNHVEVLHVSPSFTDVLGIPEKDKYAFMNWFTYVNPEDIPMLMEANQKGMKPPFEFNQVIRYQHPEKGLRWLDIRAKGIAYQDEPEKIEFANGIIVDITDQKKAEEELVTQKTYLERLFESTPEAVVILDNNDKVQRINPEFTKIFGYTFEEALGKQINDLIVPEDLKTEGEKATNDVAKGKSIALETVRKHKNGKKIHVSILGNPIMLDNKQIAVYGIYRDITERKKAENKLKEAKEKAEESDRLKTAFLANMSHEIRTPMSGILGFISLLEEPGLSEEKRKSFTQVIYRSSDRLLNTINDIIAISKIESGQVVVEESEVSVNNLLDEISDFFTPEAEEKGLKLIINKTLNKRDCCTNTDNDKLYRILSNLTKNAIKFTDKGSITIGYTLKKEGHKPRLEFYVEDTGIGIPENRQQAIFNRFEQADIEDTRAYEGSGLGLAICKAYAEMLGGEIHVISEEQKGSTFVFTIPYKTSLISIEKCKEINKLPDRVLGNIKIKLLIAEDDQFCYEFIETILEDPSFELIRATDGVETVELCKKHPDIDVILMDIKMPVLNGYEATKQIRSFNKDVKIIAQTAFALEGDRDKAIEAGCNDF